MAPITLLQRNCKTTKIELQRRVSGAGACHSALGGPQSPPSGGAVWRCRGRWSQYAFHTQFLEYPDFSLATLNTASSCTCQGFTVAEIVIMTLTQEHWWVNAESARWIGHLIQRAQPQRRCCIGMQQRCRMGMCQRRDRFKSW